MGNRTARATLAACAVALAALVLAWQQRFVQDDAFITFLYARNWVQGHGLTWFGTRVEGYTNFLWVAWSALGLRLGAEPVVWSYAGGLAAFAATLHATWRLGAALIGTGALGLVPLLLLATNASMLRFATGGLETSLQAALVAQGVLQLVRLRAAVARRAANPGTEAGRGELWRPAAALGTVLAASLLTRPDSVVAAVVLGGSAFLALVPQGALGTPLFLEARRARFGLLFPLLLLVLPWLGWKLAYYGSLLPNTFAAKVAWSGPSAAAGVLYVWRFLHAYLLWPFLAVIAIDEVARGFANRRPAPPSAAPPAGDRALPPGVAQATWRTIAVLLGLWCIYLVAIGGDFMEFRLCVPLVPLLFLVLASKLHAALPRRFALPALAGLVLVLGLASLQHARRFTGVTADHRLDSVPALATFYGLYPDGDFSVLGRELRGALAGTEAFVALHAVGAIPYYSGLHTLDMFGLNDRRVARSGHRAPPEFRRPGHQRQVTLADLRERGVHLVIGHPTLIPSGALGGPHAGMHTRWARDMLGYSQEPIGRVRLVGMPASRGELLMWYLTPTPALDAVIGARGWDEATLDAGD